jgi:AAA domain
MLKVINMYAGPGAGKSTTAAGLFFKMKSAQFSVELVTEYAKDKVYEGHLGCLEDQIYIFGKQQRRLNRLRGHVEWAITDSPLILSILYNKDLSPTFNNLVLETFNKYINYNFFIQRVKEYKQIGRTQTELEAMALDKVLTGLLADYEIPYNYIRGNILAPEEILEVLNI